MFSTKSRYINVLLIILSITIVFSSFNTSAHPASDMNVSYDLENQTLDVSITHYVSDSQSHFIENITIRKNDKIIDIKLYSSQPTNSSFVYTYDVNASKGDKIEVFSDCNLGGSLTEQITIDSKDASTDDQQLTIQDITYYSLLGIPFIVYLGLVTLIFFIIAAALPILKQKKIAKISVKWHIRLAYIAIILAIIHGILGFLIYI